MGIQQIGGFGGGVQPSELGDDSVRASVYHGESPYIRATTVHPLDATTSNNLVDGVLRLQHILLPQTTDIDTVFWIQETQGAYTSDNFNGVAVFSSDGTDLTRLAISADDGNIWKAATGLASKQLSTTLSELAAGSYWIAMLYNQSAQTTAPALACRGNPLSTGVNAAYLTGSEAWTGYVAGQSTIPSTIAWSGVTKNGTFIRPVLGLGLT